jgi:transposase
MLREWWTRDHRSAIRAISPERQRYGSYQDRALNSEDVVAFLEHLLQEVPGRMVIIWDGSPMHRSQLIKELLANGAAPRLHLERLPTDAPELNPDEGLWAQLKGVERRHVCCGHLPPRRGDTRATNTAYHPRVFHRGRTLDHEALVSSNDLGTGLPVLTRGDRHLTAEQIMHQLPGPILPPLATVMIHDTPGRQVMRQHAPGAAAAQEIADGVQYLALRICFRSATWLASRQGVASRPTLCQ